MLENPTWLAKHRYCCWQQVFAQKQGDFVVQRVKQQTAACRPALAGEPCSLPPNGSRWCIVLRAFPDKRTSSDILSSKRVLTKSLCSYLGFFIVFPTTFYKSYWILRWWRSQRCLRCFSPAPRDCEGTLHNWTQVHCLKCSPWVKDTAFIEY